MSTDDGDSPSQPHPGDGRHERMRSVERTARIHAGEQMTAAASRMGADTPRQAHGCGTRPRMRESRAFRARRERREHSPSGSKAANPEPVAITCPEGPGDEPTPGPPWL